jgi:hypothetical protein
MGNGVRRGPKANAVTAGSTAEARVSATASQTTATVTHDTLTLTATITALGSVAITELGAFDAAGSGSPATGGSIDFYCDFAAMNMSSDDSITFALACTQQSLESRSGGSPMREKRSA